MMTVVLLLYMIESGGIHIAGGILFTKTWTWNDKKPWDLHHHKQHGGSVFQQIYCPTLKTKSTPPLISNTFKTSWWFQPIWKILVKLDHLPN